MSSVRGLCPVAPSTPKPPALVTAATTSRQWLKAKIGNSIPRRSQTGVCMAGFPFLVAGPFQANGRARREPVGQESQRIPQGGDPLHRGVEGRRVQLPAVQRAGQRRGDRLAL